VWCHLPQAIEWLKVHIKAAGQTPEVLPMHDPHFQNSLELAVRFGKVREWCQARTILPVKSCSLEQYQALQAAPAALLDF
jgi:hypothetical protein